MVVKTETVYEMRPRLADEFVVGEFVARTPAIADAYQWGKELHKDQKRLSGEPYFETHCVWVASFLDQLIGNEAWTIAALLHDSVEDKELGLDRIRARFAGELGDKVAYIVDGVTKLSAPRGGLSREMEALRKLAMFRDPGVYLVKLADKSHNLMTLQHMPEEKRIQKASEAIRAYGRLAGILNCYRWRRWLEDMAFPYADPETFTFVKSRIDNDPRLNPDFINPMVDQLARVMDKTGISGSVQITVNGYWQAWQKLRRMASARRASMNNFSAVNDMVSFRLVLDGNDEASCYQLLASANRFLGPYLDQNRFDDYIACPQNGYRALQITAWLPDAGAVEVAIATEDMEGENTWGIIYALKQGRDISDYRPIEILTPSGSTRFVPEGSTVLDAVASIQQEFLLDKISSVEVNGTLARLSDQVKPGDLVEVITQGKRIIPSEEWLSYANPTTARLLRAVLAVEGLKKSADKGRQQVRYVLSQRGVGELDDIHALEHDRLDNLLEQLGAANIEDLYSATGSGAIRLIDLSRKLDEIGINKDTLKWNTIIIWLDAVENRPGAMAKLTAVVSRFKGNILRLVGTTLPDGAFMMRLVVSEIPEDAIEKVKLAYDNCGVITRSVEII